MKRRGYIVWFLMAVSLIMLTAAVIPHHHHREVLCLQHDIDVCDTSFPVQKENKDCQACCVTKFFCSVPQHNINDIQPCDLPAIILFTVTDVLNLLPPELETHPGTFIYIESLHGTRLIPSAGLRAPPSELFCRI